LNEKQNPKSCFLDGVSSGAVQTKSSPYAFLKNLFRTILFDRVIWPNKNIAARQKMP